MRVTHITEEMARQTTQALLHATPPELKVLRANIPPLVEQWITVMETEFHGYRYREDLGFVVKCV